LVLLCKERELSLDELCSVALGDGVEVCESSLSSLSRARSTYEARAREGGVYGYQSGLGALAGVTQGSWPGRERQVLVEHDVTVGPEAPRELVRAAMAVRASQLAQGAAPVRPLVLGRLVTALNKDVIPVVGLHGSVGASGDLAPLARVVRCIFYGEGEAIVKGRRTSCSEALAELGGPVKLEAGEALALINSDAWSVGLTGLGICMAQRLLLTSLEVAKRTLLVTGCNPQHFSDAVAQAKGGMTADIIRSLGPSPCPRSPRVQDPYSIRCIPQVYGSAAEFLEAARRAVEREASRPSENPFVWGDAVYHACNFHAAPASIAADLVKESLAVVGNSIERRTAHLLSSATTGLPEFLTAKSSVVGGMIYQYTAAALAARLRSLASPSAVNSLPTSGLQEDVVSMAPNAALDLLAAVATFLRLTAVENALAKAAASVSSGGGLPDPREALRESLAEVLRLSGLAEASGLLNGVW
jgi:Histidine ammonia-lyase